jgi:hypothetical protein
LQATDSWLDMAGEGATVVFITSDKDFHATVLKVVDKGCHAKLLYEACLMEKQNEMRHVVDAQGPGHSMQWLQFLRETFSKPDLQLPKEYDPSATYILNQRPQGPWPRQPPQAANNCAPVEDKKPRVKAPQPSAQPGPNTKLSSTGNWSSPDKSPSGSAKAVVTWGGWLKDGREYDVPASDAVEMEEQWQALQLMGPDQRRISTLRYFF